MDLRCGIQDYRQLFVASPHAYLVLGPDLTILDANDAYLALVGAEHPQLVGRHLFEALPARLQDAERDLRASFARVLEQGQPDTIALLHYPVHDPASAGAWRDRYWTVNNVPLFDADGAVAGVLNCPIELSSLISPGDAPVAVEEARLVSHGQTVPLINQQLTRERRRFRQLMQQAPGFVAVGHGPQHVFELANNAYYQLVGHRDILGKPVREALPELEGQGFYELLDRVYSTAEPFVGRAMPIEVQLAPDSPLVERYIDFIYQPILDEDGSVSGIFVQGHDVSEAHQLSRTVSYQAAHDVLTGLVNRREFERRLARMFEEFEDRPGPHSLLYLDLDQFKVVNDTCGHAAGDEMLRQVSTLLLSRVPVPHTVARLGGDEFGILLDGTGAGQAHAMAESLREAVYASEFVHGGRVFGCAASLGVISFGAEIGNPAEALSAADAACFLAKDKGRNRVQVHRHDDDDLAARRREMGWVSRLRGALAERRVVLHAQRIESLAAEPDPILRLELLVRLREADGSVIPPMAFIPAAERYGFMPAIDRFVIREALEFLRGLPPERQALTHLSINLSGVTLNDAGLLPYIRDQLGASQACPGQICFEVTETSAVHNLTATANLILELKALGFQFALDDFGSGMSSLGYLKHLPVDYLKIDGVFIRHVRSDPVDAVMVEAIARVAQVMGIKTVAEYVEDDATRQLLQRIGVDYAQGFGVHVPEPLADAARSGGR